MSMEKHSTRLHPNINGTPNRSPANTPIVNRTPIAKCEGKDQRPPRAPESPDRPSGVPRLLAESTSLVQRTDGISPADRPMLPVPSNLNRPQSDSNLSRMSGADSRDGRKSETTGSYPPEVTPSRNNSSTSDNETPLFQDDGFFEESDEDSSGFGNEPWDIATNVPTERVSAGDSFAGILKFIRVLMYIATFLLVWACATASMGSFLFLTASLRRGDEEQKHSAKNQLVWIICLPQLLIFIVAFFKSVFGNNPKPRAKLFFIVLLIELMHTFGLILIIFHVLPHFGSLYCIGLMNSLSIVPGILSVFFNGTLQGQSVIKKIIVKTLDVLSVLATVAVVTLPLAMELLWNMSSSFKGKESSRLRQQHLFWQVALGFVLVSLKWWENFVGLDRGCLRLYELKKAVHNTRNKLNVLISPLNILFTFGCVWILDRLNEGHMDFEKTFDPTWYQEAPEILRNCKNVTETQGNHSIVTGRCKYETEATSIAEHVPGYIPVIICAGASLILYYCCGVATKLLMQRFSCALPLTLACPSVAALVVLQCKEILPEMPVTSGLQYGFVCPVGGDEPAYFLMAAFFSWISLLWITRHIWFPRLERLSHNERIFVTRLYTGPLVTQCVMLNRRNDEQDINLVGKAKNEELDVLYKRVHGQTRRVSTETNANTSTPVPMVYACATMWHENRNEMVQLLKSIYRMDFDYCTRKIAKDVFKMQETDFYKFETHVFFDDCMELDDDDKWIVNKFVLQLKDCMQEACSAVLRKDVEIPPPQKWPTPYGGRLTWVLPGSTNLVIHLKDKNKIRHRKRWSQVMYMYYLLGYRLFDDVTDLPPAHAKDSAISTGSTSTSGTSCDNNEGLRKRSAQSDAQGQHKQSGAPEKGQTDRFMRSEIFKNMEESLVVESENTFILALDGDVDFKPYAVRLLLDRMRINPKTGASCGRIHPIGSSPMVWYQKFEYAIGHWFQKSTEHVLGCVLCSPGCFSLFRASALLDDNVMKRYTTEPTEPGHFLQYDQGEDRWLCTLLLQQGYRVDYAAASDALTYAPESFDEFFNQRRRWTPSTLANIIDLLSNAGNTVQINPNISRLYIFYQFFLMISTILGPATIILAIASAFQSVFGWDLWECYLASLAPVLFYLIICFKCPTKIQLLIGAFLSVMYAAIMTVVLVGIIQAIVSDSVLDPSLLFLVVVVVCFVFAGLIHPYEFSVLIHGILYFLCIPAGYLVLMIYSMCNLNNVSWGTREVPKRKTKAQRAAEASAAASKTKQKKQGGWYSFLKVDAFLERLKDILTQVLNKNKDNSYQEDMMKMMGRLNKSMKRMVKQQKKANGLYVESDSSDEEDKRSRTKQELEKTNELLEVVVQEPVAVSPVEDVKLDDPKDPNWIKDQRLGNGQIKMLSSHEAQFWQQFIRKYLKPLKKDIAKEKQLAAELIALRNNASFGFWFINFLWVLFNYMIQNDPNLNTVRIGTLTTEPIGFVFLIFFLFILVMQVLGMIIHRWGTLLQLISITEIQNPLSKAHAHSVDLINLRTSQSSQKLSHATSEQVVRMISQIQHDMEPEPDYPNEEFTDDSIYAEVVDLVEQHKKMQKTHRDGAINSAQQSDFMNFDNLVMHERSNQEPSHKRAIQRNLQRNIRHFRHEESHRQRHRVAQRQRRPFEPPCAKRNRSRSEPNIIDPSVKICAETRHQVDSRGGRHDRRPSQPFLDTVHENSRDRREIMEREQKMIRPPRQFRRSPAPDNPARRAELPQLQKQFIRKFHRMNSRHDPVI